MRKKDISITCEDLSEESYSALDRYITNLERRTSEWWEIAELYRTPVTSWGGGGYDRALLISESDVRRRIFRGHNGYWRVIS